MLTCAVCGADVVVVVSAGACKQGVEGTGLIAADRKW